MMGQKSKRSYVILILLIIVACGITFYRNLSYHYEMRGDVTELSYSNMEVVGYNTVSVDGSSGKNFTVAGDDPGFTLTLTTEYAAKNIGGIELRFEEAWTGEEALPVQVFYAEAGALFSERHSVKSGLKAGEQSLLLPIPVRQYETIRFDIDGDFILGGIFSCDEPMAAHAYISQDTVNICMWHFPVIIIGFSLIFWAHRVRMRQGGFTVRSYTKYIFLGADPSAGHEVYLDWLRVLAALFVILAHSCSSMLDQADANWKRLALVCGLSLGLCCNLLYVMLSGTLLLDSRKDREESVISFYIRRASKVIVPLIAYSFLLFDINDEVHFFPPQNIGNSLKRIVTGGSSVGPHLWLIYTIVALYLVTPFFRVMVQHMSDKLLRSMAVVILVLNALTAYLPLFGMTFGAATFLAGWEGVFLLGYILTRQNNPEHPKDDPEHPKDDPEHPKDDLVVAKRRNHVIMLAAVVSYIVMVVVVYVDSTQMNYIYGNTTTILITSCGIFVWFVNNKEKFKEKSNALLRLCSKYSYSIILIHWYALFVVVQGKFHITALRFGCLGGIAASVVVTFGVCIVLAVVFDNTVVIVCNALFDKLTAGLVDEKYRIQKNA